MKKIWVLIMVIVVVCAFTIFGYGRFDSWFDNYLGIVSLIRVVEGRVELGDKILVKSTGRTHLVDGLGCFTPKRKPLEQLSAGEVGFLVAGIKDIRGAPVGDTLVPARHPDTPQLPGFEKVKPQVYAGLFPVNAEDFEDFREALDKLVLNDASLHYEPETSDAVGFGFRCGFLGMLHMEIVQERLEREYGLNLYVDGPERACYGTGACLLCLARERA